MSTSPIVGHLDHIVLAAPDLLRACDDFERATGVRPALGGAHPGLGTHNALVSFDAGSYLEIIAPDPAQAGGGMARSLANLAQPAPLHWAIRVSALGDVVGRLRALGWNPSPIRRTTRTPPHGPKLEWDLCGLVNHNYGGIVPVFIDWLASPHPAVNSPRVGALLSLDFAAPEPEPAQTLLTMFGISARITRAPAAMAFRFASPNGEIEFSGTAPRGFTLGN
ncbi:MAG: VOC family protein [Gammaproteobacteria bacterium]